MKQRDLRIARLQMVLREYLIALVATAILDEHLKMKPSTLTDHDLRVTDLRRFRANIESTYLIRLFAEFESALRVVWSSIGRETQPRTTDLVDGLVSRRRIPTHIHHEAHEVRRYRNALVHEESTDATPVSVSEAIRRLVRFLGYMPADW